MLDEPTNSGFPHSTEKHLRERRFLAERARRLGVCGCTSSRQCLYCLGILDPEEENHERIY